METWEKDLIHKNRDRLITNTICSTLFLNMFLSKNILSFEDVQNIEAEGISGRLIQAASKFYDLLITRAHSFEFLLEALQQTNQSGALIILRSNFDNQHQSRTSALSEVQPLNHSQDPNMTINQHGKRKFRDVPDYLQQFLGDKKKTTLIISSEDCNITCSRIKQTLENCKLFHLLSEFLEFVTNRSASITSLPILNCENILEETLRLTSKLKPKIVLVADKVVDKDCENYVNIINSNLHKSHMKFIEDNITWNDLTLTFGLELCTQLETDPGLNLSRNEILEALEEADYPTFVKLINEQTPTLFKETIPKQIKNYIPRSLSPRCLVGNQIFKINSEDIFFFEDITLESLRHMTIQKVVTNSGSIIQEGYQLYSRFVVLDQEDHFDRICKNIKTKSFHLLKCDGINFVWRKTLGQIDTIQLSLLSNQQSLPENEVIRTSLTSNSSNRQPICISDTPGMGKSVLLANIAQKIAPNIMNGLVGFIVISELVRDIMMLTGTQYQTSEQTIADVITNAIVNNSFGKVFLRKNTNYLKEIFLDGFDEINQEDEIVGFNVLISIPKIFPNARLWVTTRPHMLLKLERVLGVMGYNILPFCDDDQVSFLTSFWKINSPIELDPRKLANFAEQCLDQIKSTVDAREQDIAGIPLQCLLIAEVFEDEASEFCRSKLEFKSSRIAIHHMIELYERLVEKKFSIFFARYKSSIQLSSSRSFLHEFLRNFLPSNILGILYDSDITQQKLVNIHVFKSVELFFPKVATKLRKILCPKDLLDRQIVNCGLMELKNTSSPSFVHRTIAEYFVATFFLESFNKRHKTSTRDLIFAEIFRTQSSDFILPNQIIMKIFEFKNNVICYFFDALLGRKDIASKLIKELFAIDYVDTQRKLAKACAAGNFQNIFTFIVSKETLNFLSNKEFIQELLCITVFRGCLKMLNMYTDLSVPSTITIQTLRFKDYTLLHYAVAGGHFQMVKHLCENENFTIDIKTNTEDFKDLVYLSVMNTKSLNDKHLEDRLQILNYIWNNNKELFSCDIRAGKVVFLLNDVHSKLSSEIYYLIRQDIFTTELFLSILVDILDEKMYVRVLRALFHEKENSEVIRLLTSANMKDFILLQQIVLTLEPVDDLCDFLSTFDFGELSLSSSIFIAAVDSRRDKKWLIWLLKNTRVEEKEIFVCLPYLLTIFDNDRMLHVLELMNPKSVFANGDNVLHRMFTFSESEKYKHNIYAERLVKYLVKKGVDVNATNEDKQTPLHKLAFQSVLQDTGYIAKILSNSGANIDAQDADGNTPLHILLNKPAPVYVFLSFLNCGPDVNIENFKNETPMLQAMVRYEWGEALKFLITKGSPDYTKIYARGNSVLHLLLENSIHNKDDFRFLDSHLRSINCIHLLQISNESGKTPISIAMRKNLISSSYMILLSRVGITLA